jgi:RND family efflux transporter MFP subunit
MKRIIFLIGIILVTAGCNNSDDESKSQEIKKQITEYRMEIKDLENKIAELEKQLTDTVVSDGSLLVGIKTVKPEKFIKYVEVTGSVESDLQALISPEINGQISKIHVKEGDYVTRGTLLVSLKTEITEKAIDEVKTALELANTVYKKQKELWDQQIGSEIQYLQAKNRKESLERKLETLKTQKQMAGIKAPFDGYVETVYQKEGEIASPGRQVLMLVNLEKLKVTADISEVYLPNVHKGDMVLLSYPTFPEITMKRPISVVGSVINPNNRTVKIQINIDNPGKKLKPNIIANVKFKEFEMDSAFVVPSIIIKNDADGRSYLYVVAKHNNATMAVKRFVETGDSYGNKTVIIKGLKAGDRIVYQGYNLVKNGSLIHF